jgi:hypothetical protein
MKRVPAILLASSLVFWLSSTARAQQYIVPGAVVDADGDGFVDGSFGGNYVQRPPITGVPGNRWNMWGESEHPNGVVPPVAEAQPYVGPPQAAVAPQPRTVVTRRGLLGRRRVYTQASGGPAYYRNQLPQTRIYGDGSIMAPNGYSPANRQQTYGEGYGLGAYGTNYYSNYYQGRPIYP